MPRPTKVERDWLLKRYIYLNGLKDREPDLFYGFCWLT